LGPGDLSKKTTRGKKLLIKKGKHGIKVLGAAAFVDKN